VTGEEPRRGRSRKAQGVNPGIRRNDLREALKRRRRKVLQQSPEIPLVIRHLIFA